MNYTSPYLAKVIEFDCLGKPDKGNIEYTTFYLFEKGQRNLKQCFTIDLRRDIVRYCYEAAMGLKELHNLGYAHRDITHECSYFPRGDAYQA